MKILIVRLSAIGDAALTLPLFFTLRRALPDATIGWVIEEKCADLLNAVDGIARVHVWRATEKNLRGAWKLSRELRAENYDVALDAQGLTKSALLPFLAGIKRRIGFRRAPLEARELSPLLNNELVAPPEKITHIALRSRYLITPLLDTTAAAFTDLPEKYAFKLPAPPLTASNKWFVFGIGTSWETKILPVEYLRELADAVRARGLQPLVIWGPAETEKIPQWQEILGARVLWAPRTANLAELIALLNCGVAYAGPDSAPLHLAWLLGKPTFSWFGASCARRGAPVGKRHRHVVAHPPTRQRYGAPMWGLKPEIILPPFNEWLENL